jgi:hypothetical protein
MTLFQKEILYLNIVRIAMKKKNDINDLTFHNYLFQMV